MNCDGFRSWSLLREGFRGGQSVMNRESLRRLARLKRIYALPGSRRNQHSEEHRLVGVGSLPRFRGISQWAVFPHTDCPVAHLTAPKLSPWWWALPSHVHVRHFAGGPSRVARPLLRSFEADGAPPEPEKPGRRINRAIVARTIRLITDNGHEVLTRAEALKRAGDLELDLVEVDSKQDPPVCKLLDNNKEKFMDKQRKKETKKRQIERQRLDDVKEVRFSTRTERNDLKMKADMAQRLIAKGHRVKLAVEKHGNDDLETKGRALIDQMMGFLKEVCKIDSGPRVEKQRAWVLVRPTAVAEKKGSRKKKEAQEEINEESPTS